MTLDLVPAVDVAPIPGPHWLFHGLLVFTFWLHLLFMNLTLGGTLLAAIAHLTSRGRLDDPRTTLARRLVGINTFGISLTITTGVAPLLFVQVLFQQYFYTATILIGLVWLTLLLLLMVGYYAVYVYKFGPSTGERETRGGWIGFAAVAFLAIAMIQVAVNLIHSQPGRWAGLAEAPWSILADPTYIARFLHFLLAALGFSALVCAWWATRQARRGVDPELNASIAAYGWRWVLWTTVLQIADGILLLFLMPGSVVGGLLQGGALPMALLGASTLLALGLLVLLARVRDPSASAGTVGLAVGAMTLILVLMAILRHTVRTLYLDPYTSRFEIATAPQWGNFALFAVALVAGLVTVAYMIRKVLNSPARGAEAA